MASAFRRLRDVLPALPPAKLFVVLGVDAAAASEGPGATAVSTDAVFGFAPFDVEDEADDSLGAATAPSVAATSASTYYF